MTMQPQRGNQARNVKTMHCNSLQAKTAQSIACVSTDQSWIWVVADLQSAGVSPVKLCIGCLQLCHPQLLLNQRRLQFVALAGKSLQTNRLTGKG